MAEAVLVDSGVFIRWFIKQDWEEARSIRNQFLAGRVELQTVDVVRLEVGDVLRKAGFLRKLLTREEYIAAARVIDDFGIIGHVTDADALGRAAALATRRMVGFFDAVITERAMERGLTLLTTDAKLCRAVEGLLSTELLGGLDSS